MAITNVFFDFDGTLVDSFPGISFSAASAIKQVFPGRIIPDLLPHIGPPVQEVFRRSLNEHHPENLQQLEKIFRLSYDTEGWCKSEAYPGAEKVLSALKKGGLICHVLTNKPMRPTLAILGHLSLGGYFAEVISPDARAQRFASKSEAALDARERLGLSNGEALVVGDSTDDAKAAEMCAFQFAAVTFGYGKAYLQCDHTVHCRLNRLEDLLIYAPLAGILEKRSK